jgi:zinc protease
MNLHFTKTTLANGLDVIVHSDHHAPIVAVNVWYHVGSKNERPGLTGLAHLFEHLMFEGSEHAPDGYFGPLQRAGASVNGSTSTDRTNYYEVVPRGALELALWMEADRMGWLLPALTEARFNTQRDVVLNERRQSYENRPYGLASFAIHDGIYPKDHPYHWPTIGDPADLAAATVDDARAFFLRCYHPANASLAIAGDIGEDEAVKLAASVFEEIPAGEPVPALANIAPVETRVRQFVLEDRIEQPRLYLVWTTPGLFAPDDAELDLLADLLANGKTSRLYRKLVHDQRIATELAASQGSCELGSLFQIVATAAPGHTLEEIERAILAEVARLGAHGPSPDELQRGKVQSEAAFLHRLQTAGGFGGKSDQLNAYNIYRGTPDYFQADLERYLSATTEGVRAAVERWLTAGARLTLSVVPKGRADLALPGSVPTEVR